MYQKRTTQKASPSPRSRSESKELKPSGGYGSLSEVVQRAQREPSQVGESVLLQLDRAVGTRATGQILAEKQTPMPEYKSISTQLWSNKSDGSTPIQRKLTIGAVGDKYEQEADRVAASVVQQINRPATVSSAQGEMVQGKEQEEEEELRMKPMVQRKEAIGGGEASTELSGEINRARGGGQPLEPILQQSMGQAMGADFSGVRVHTDGHADRLNRALSSRAFTTGRDLFFKQGKYQPGSREGQGLIAHELAHVMQQSRQQQEGSKVQRDYLDEGDRSFEEDTRLPTTKGEFPWINIRSKTLRSLVKQVRWTQTVLKDYANGSGWRTREKALKELVTLQRYMEKWRYEKGEEFAMRGDGDIWRQLNDEVKEKIEEITSQGVAGEEFDTGRQLAEKYEAQLKSMAMRVLISNACNKRGDYRKSIASNLAVKRRVKYGGWNFGFSNLSQPTREEDPSTGNYTEKALERSQEELEETGMGNSIEIARAAAHLLRGHNVRVEIMDREFEPTCYVVLGRNDYMGRLDRIENWGEGCVIVDVWRGAITWRSVAKEPQVIYEIAEHRRGLGGLWLDRVIYEGR